MSAGAGIVLAAAGQPGYARARLLRQLFHEALFSPKSPAPTGGLRLAARGGPWAHARRKKPRVTAGLQGEEETPDGSQANPTNLSAAMRGARPFNVRAFEGNSA